MSGALEMQIARATDFGDADHPDKIPGILRRAAEQAYDAAGELESAWQDKAAGKPWLMVARELERCADRIEGKLP
jgi:hypothetical protein